MNLFRTSKKGMIFNIFLVIITVIVLTTAFVKLTNKFDNFEKVMGEHQLEQILKIQKGEKSLACIDIAARIGMHESLYNLQLAGGTSGDCGKYYGFNLWHDVDGKDCSPNDKGVEEGLKNEFKESFKSYYDFCPGDFVRSFLTTTEIDSIQTQAQSESQKSTLQCDGEAKFGAWIWTIAATGKSASEVAQEAKDLGIDFVLLKSGDSGSFWPEKFNQQIVDEFTSRGIDLYAWYWVVPWNIDAQVKSIKKTLEIKGVKGIILDAEKDFKSPEKYKKETVSKKFPNGKDPPEFLSFDERAFRAQELCTKIRQEVKGAFIGFSSYGLVSNHKSLPWKAFDEYCGDAHLPQVYWVYWGGKKGTPDGSVDVALEQIKKMGLKAPVWPAQSSEKNPSAEDMNKFFEAAGNMASIWYWPNPKYKKEGTYDDMVVQFKNVNFNGECKELEQTTPAVPVSIPQGSNVKDPSCLILYGDSRGTGNAQTKVLDRIEKECDSPTLFHAGDMVGTGGNKKHWDRFLLDHETLFSKGYFYGTVGNHETYGRTDKRGDLAIAENMGEKLPYVAEQMKDKGNYMAELTSDLILVTLNNELECSVQIEFLEEKLAANQNKNVMLMVHKPGFPLIQHGAHGCSKNKLNPLLAEHATKGNKVCLLQHTHTVCQELK